MDKNMEAAIVFWGNIWNDGKKMETTTMGYTGFRVQGLGVRLASRRCILAIDMDCC